MDWTAIRNDIAGKAVFGILALAVGFLFGTNETAKLGNDLKSVSAEVSTLKANDKARHEFLNCVQLALQSLRQGVRTEQVCQLKAE